MQYSGSVRARRVKKKNWVIYSHSASAESGIPKKVVSGQNSVKMCIMAPRALLYTFLCPPPFFLFFLPPTSTHSSRLVFAYNILDSNESFFKANFYLHIRIHQVTLPNFSHHSLTILPISAHFSAPRRKRPTDIVKMRWTSTADHIVSPKVHVFAERDDQMLDSVDILCFQLLVKILETGNFNVDTVRVAEAWRKYLFYLFSATLYYTKRLHVNYALSGT